MATALGIAGQAEAAIFDFSELTFVEYNNQRPNPLVTPQSDREITDFGSELIELERPPYPDSNFLLEQTWNSAFGSQGGWSINGNLVNAYGRNTNLAYDTGVVDAFLNGGVQSQSQFGGRSGGLGVCSNVDSGFTAPVASGGSAPITCGQIARNPDGSAVPNSDFRGDAHVGESRGGIELLSVEFADPVRLFDVSLLNQAQAVLNGSSQRSANENDTGTIDDFEDEDGNGDPIPQNRLLFAIGSVNDPDDPILDTSDPRFVEVAIDNGSLRDGLVIGGGTVAELIDGMGPLTQFTLAFGGGAGPNFDPASFTVASIQTSPVPVPPALLLLASALGGLFVLRQRREA